MMQKMIIVNANINVDEMTSVNTISEVDLDGYHKRKQIFR